MVTTFRRAGATIIMLLLIGCGTDDGAPPDAGPESSLTEPAETELVDDSDGADQPTHTNGYGIDPDEEEPDADAASNLPASPTGGPGTYGGQTVEGATVRITLPTDDNPAVAELEELRDRFATVVASDNPTAADFAGVAYASVEVDNRSGDERALFSEFAVVTDGGETVTFRPAWWVLGEWQDALGVIEGGEIEALYDDSGTLYNRLLDEDIDALPGAVGGGLYVSDGPLDSIARVFTGNATELTLTDG